jgi:predicted RNA-binding protein YlxR (DUF448 family)
MAKLIQKTATKTRHSKDVHTPVRRCVATGVILPKERLLRFVQGPEGRVVFDVAGNLPGRGWYLLPSKEALAQAIKRRAFAFKAKHAVVLSDDLPEKVAQLLQGDLSQRLGLARKSGDVVMGFEKLAAALKKQELSLVFLASDASENTVQKMQSLMHEALPTARILSREQLSMALGENNLVHLGVKSVIVARKLCRSVVRYRAFVESWDAKRTLLPYAKLCNDA